MWCVKHINFNSTIKIFPQATLQDVTILVAVVPKILKLVTWFVKNVSLNQKIWLTSKNFNLEGWQ